MKVEVIPNRGPASLGPEIERSLSWAGKADIATAFITPVAVDRLRFALEVAERTKRPFKIRLLFGLYQRFTPPEALSRMLSLKRAYPGRLFIRVARNNRFHWKAYIFQNDSSRRLYVGSANFTQDGLLAEGELSIKITAQRKDAIAQSLQNEFDQLWQNPKDSCPLDSSLLNKYRRVARPLKTYVNPAKDSALAKVLRRPARVQQPRLVKAKPRISFISEFMSDDTEQIIETETNWSSKGWGYTCYPQKYWYDLALAARVLLLVSCGDRPREYWLEFVRVVDNAVLETPDGKYFLAHEHVPYGWRRKYDVVKRDLAKIGLSWKKIKAEYALTVPQVEEVCRLLHLAPEKL